MGEAAARRLSMLQRARPTPYPCRATGIRLSCRGFSVHAVACSSAHARRSFRSRVRIRTFWLAIGRVRSRVVGAGRLSTGVGRCLLGAGPEGLGSGPSRERDVPCQSWMAHAVRWVLSRAQVCAPCVSHV